ALAAAAAGLPPSLGRAARLTSLVQELDSGHSHLLDNTPRQRAELLGGLRRVLQSPAWSEFIRTARTSAADADERHRAAWIERTLARRSPEPSGLRIEVVVPDPAVSTQVETRILVDGRPVIADAFDKGPPHSPEYVLGPGLLRAAEEPQEVQLAEAWCTEGCCGALYVTVVREGDTVVWRDWKRPGDSKNERPLPTLRFDATAYDAEVERATQDHSWEWPARTLARLLGERLRAEPELTARWDCRLGWIGTHYAVPDQVQASFSYPRSRRQGSDAPWLQFIWSPTDDGTPPEAQVDALVRRLQDEDLTTIARLAGGSAESAAALGFDWPPA
ncbi:hypothetical protein P8605_42880, partial [Streptomyces sp. T-3]|nr:hypothetical protein [Streptomyces sp. T-3]